MGLEYIKINDKILDFSGSVTKFAAVNNAGKSSLVYLIKFIYGGKKSLYSDKNFFKDYKKSKRKDLYIAWKFKGEFYNYNFENDTIQSDSGEISIEEYRKKYVKQIEIFGQKVNVNNQIYLKDNTLLSSKPKAIFFPSNNESYNAYFILSLLTDNSSLLETKMYRHFSGIANLKKLEKKTNDMKKEVQIEISDIEEQGFSDVHEIFMQLNKLKTMKKDSIDSKILAEMESLVPDERIKKAIIFHNSIVGDYNSLISSRKKELLKKLGKYNLQDTTMQDASIAYKTFLETANNISIQKNKEIEQMIVNLSEDGEYSKLEEKFLKYNKNIEEFIGTKYNEIFEGNEYNYKNTFSIKNDKTAINFDIDSHSSQGDGSRQVNYILFMLYLLNNSNLLDLFIVDTTSTNEIDERLIKLNNVISHHINKNKKCIIFTHPEKSPELESYDKENPIFLKL